MDLISIIQPLFEAARLSRQNGGTNHYTSYYYSIYKSGFVKESNNVVTSVLDDPSYIVCCTLFEYNEYGRRVDSQIFAYVSRSGEASRQLTLSKWALQDIRLFANSLIQGATMQLLADPSQIFSFDDRSGMPIKSVQSLWTLFSEIDVNCSTAKEAKFYFDYFVNKLEVDEMSFSLEDYKNQLQESKSVNKQYQDLLNRISALVKN